MKATNEGLEPTTEGINYFRITQPDIGAKWSAKDDELLRQVDAVYKEISKDNQELRSTDDVLEKTFDIRVNHPICEMRKDTQLVLIDIPGIDERKLRSKDDKVFLKWNWKTFDCVVVVLDAKKGVNAKEQDLLELVERNNSSLKDVPTIVVGNKIDNPNSKGMTRLVEEIHSKTIEIFGNVNYRPISQNGENDGEAEPSPTNTNEAVTKTVFIPLSAENAFPYMKVASNSELQKLCDGELFNQIGYNECGLKWSRMKEKEQILVVSELLQDPEELRERLASTNYLSFHAALSNFVGGREKQHAIVVNRVEKELGAMRFESLGEKSISESISEAFKMYQSLEQSNKVEELQTAFWRLYQECEDECFGYTHYCSSDDLQDIVDPKPLQRPYTELEKYHELSLVLEWKEECVRVIGAMKQLLRQQLTFLLEELKDWDFKDYCLRSGGSGRRTDPAIINCSSCAKNNESAKIDEMKHCSRTLKWKSAHPRYFVCGEYLFLEWKKGWVVPEALIWENISPNDWILILESLSLVWNQNRFIEDFGPEKIKLDRALMNMRCTFGSFFGVNFDTCDSPPKDRLCLYAYREQMEENKAPLEARVKCPESLTDPSHWGFLAWKYINFCGRQKRKASTISD